MTADGSRVLRMGAVRTRRVVGAACIALVALGAAACSSSKSVGTTDTPNKTWLVGSIISETGAAASDWANTAASLRAWVSWTNAHGGINGYQIKMKIVDDQSTPSGGLRAANELINAHVLALVQGGTSTSSAWASAIEKAGIPVIGGAPSGAPPWGVDKMFYPVSTSGLASTYLLMKGAVDKGAKKIGMLYCAETPTCAQIVPFAATSAGNAGATLVKSQAVSATSPSFAAPCLALKSAGVDAVLAVVSSGTMHAIATQCAQQGFKPVWFPPSIKPSMATDPVFENFVGFTENFPWFADTPVAKTYREAMQQYDPASLENEVVNGPIMWATGMLFRLAAETAKLGDQASSQQLVAALNTISNNNLDGASAPLTFTDGKRAVNCGWIVSSSGGNFVLPNGPEPVCIPASASN